MDPALGRQLIKCGRPHATQSNGMDSSSPGGHVSAKLDDFTPRFNPVEQCLNLGTPDQLALPDCLFRTIYAVQLKDILCQIDPNADKLHDLVLLSKPVVWKLQLGNYVPSGGGGVHPIADGPGCVKTRTARRPRRHSAL